MATYIDEDVATYTERELSGRYMLGAEYTDKSGRTFRFLKLVDAVIAKNGMVATWASTTKNEITMDRSGGSSLGNFAAAVSVGTVTAASPYAFWLVRGRHPNVLNGGWPSATIALGGKVEAGSFYATDGGAEIIGAYTYIWFGVALAVISQSGPVEVNI